MDDKSLENLQKVGGLLRSGGLYLLAGAGLSCRADLPSWEKLFEQCVNEFANLDGESDLTRDLSYLARKMDPFCFTKLREEHNGKIALRQVFRRNFMDERCDDSHKILLELPFDGYITVNYDRCLETACKEVPERKQLEKERWFCFPKHGAKDKVKATRGLATKEVFNGEPFILHIHGCFCHNGKADLINLVLDSTQYEYVYSTNIMKELVEQMSCRALLMLGTSFGDPYFQNMLYKMRGALEERNFYNAEEWFLVLPESERAAALESVYSKSFTISYIFYKDGDQEEDGFKRFIERLLREFKKILPVYVYDKIKVSESTEIK